MQREILTPHASADATVIRGGVASESLAAKGRYDAICYGPDGKEKWRAVAENIVTTAGKNDLLNKYLTGSAYTQTIRMGLKGTGTAVVGDTQASHASWSEVGLANAPTYTGSRKSVAMGTSTVDSSVSPAQVFAITSTGTVAGCFI